MTKLPDSTLYLELILNGKSSGEVIPVKYAQGRFYLPRGTLQGLGLKTPGEAQEIIAVDSVVEVTYDSNAQQLLLTAPADQLPTQYIQGQNQGKQLAAVSDPGILINYDAYASRPQQQEGRYLALTSELRGFGRFGILSNTGIYKHRLGGQRNTSQEGYLRYDTQWRYSDEARMLTYQVGDLITGSLPWSSSVRLGGIQLARNFTLRPDLVTYPLPQFAGQAAVPSAVDLFINSYKTRTTQVNPGPFTMETVPFINGAGQATVVVTDAQGKTVSTTLPFYVASKLLKKGLVDYSASIGALRRDYGIQSFSYKDAAASGLIRYGVFDFLTVEGQAEGAQGLSVAGAGVGAKLGILGVLNIATRQSNANAPALSGAAFTQAGQSERGEQNVFGYSYSGNYISVSAQRMLNSAGFVDLGGYRTSSRPNRRSDVFSTSVNLGYAGSVGTGYFLTQAMDNSRARLVNISYSNSLWKNINLYAAMNRAIGTKGYNAQLQITIPFNDLGSVSASVNQNAARQRSQQLNYNRSIPSDGGFGWNLAYGHAEKNYQQASLAWRNRHFQVQGGAYGITDNRTAWGEVNGSVVMMNGEMYAANQVNDAFVLVSTDYPKVPVYYENQLIGAADKDGYVLVPSVGSHYPGQFAIDTLQLPANVRIPKVEQQLAVRERSGALLRLPVQKVYAASMILQDVLDQPLPRGSLVRLQGSNYQTYVGWNGWVYVEELNKDNQLEVTLPDQQTCRARFTADLSAAMPLRFAAPLSCKPSSIERYPDDSI
jgi:outer membrane usher protein